MPWALSPQPSKSSASMRPNAELLSAAYDAFNRREIDEILAMMHPDVDWPNAMDGGRVHGRTGVRNYWERQWSMINPRVEPLAFERDEAGRTIVDVHQVVRDNAGNVIVDQMVRYVYSIRDGLIERMDIQDSTVDAILKRLQ
jgi:ketosteroid isomerase-like protein